MLLLLAVLAPAVSLSIIGRAVEDNMYCYVYQCLLPDKIYYKRIDFSNEETSVAWTEEMESLKARCRPEERAVFRTAAEFLEAQEQWVRDCRRWAEDYGKNIVPDDMRCKINESERELGYEPTIFGADEGVFYQSRNGI